MLIIRLFTHRTLHQYTYVMAKTFLYRTKNTMQKHGEGIIVIYTYSMCLAFPHSIAAQPVPTVHSESPTTTTSVEPPTSIETPSDSAPTNEDPPADEDQPSDEDTPTDEDPPTQPSDEDPPTDEELPSDEDQPSDEDTLSDENQSNDEASNDAPASDEKPRDPPTSGGIISTVASLQLLLITATVMLWFRS